MSKIINYGYNIVLYNKKIIFYLNLVNQRRCNDEKAMEKDI